jgi:hypothetical protein
MRLRRGGGHTHRLEVVAHPDLVAGLLVHVLVEEVAHMTKVVGHAAGRRRGDGVEVPDHVVELEQQRTVTLHAHAVRDRIHQDRMGFELPTGFVGPYDQLTKHGTHPLTPTTVLFLCRGVGPPGTRASSCIADCDQSHKPVAP